MTSPTSHFSRYVKSVGGRPEAARRLKISVGMVGHIETERRGISIDVAKRIEQDTNAAITRFDLRPDVFGVSPASLENAA